MAIQNTNATVFFVGREVKNQYRFHSIKILDRAALLIFRAFHQKYFPEKPTNN